VGTLLPRSISNGRALWGTHALWVTVLDHWQEEHGREAWPGIEFDKLAHFLHLIWNALHKEKLVSFPSAYRSANGVHGPGPALPKRNSPNRHIFALPALEHLQEVLKDNPDVQLFDLDISTYAGKKQYAVKPGRERTYEPRHLSNTLPNAWSGEDQASIAELIALTSKLTQDQIRMLGTHQSRKGTIEAIEYNVFIQLFLRLIQEIDYLEGSKKPRSTSRPDIVPLETVVDEVANKATRNKTNYASGRKTMQELADKGNKAARLAVDTVFDPEASIWMNAVVRWRDIYPGLNHLVSYIKALKLIRGQAKLHSSASTERAAGQRAAKYIRETFQVHLPDLPTDQSDAYPWGELREAIVKIFDSLPFSTDSDSRKEYFQRAESFRTLL
jgi:hypothetical protein